MTADYDAVVIGSGPNGLVAAVTIAMAGRRVVVFESADVPGGGMRTEELTAPGFLHDVCSAVHPLGIGSLAMRELPLTHHGLRWIQPDVPLAHPLDGAAGTEAALLHRSIPETASGLGRDGPAWASLMAPFSAAGMGLVDDLLSPLGIPRHPVAAARYGIVGVRPATHVARRRFAGERARALLTGLSAHSILPLDQVITAGFGVMLGALGHLAGWPIAAGGSKSIADALLALLTEHGGEVVCGHRVDDLSAVPEARAVLADVAPGALVELAGDRLPWRYRRRLLRFRHGPAAFKVDYALSGPVPWTDPQVGSAGTVHLGGTLEEIAASEGETTRGRHAARPFVLVCQPSTWDPGRAPAGQHTLWTYCHVPNGSTVDMTERIEAQIERFAPGFRDLVIARHASTPADIEAHNPNYVGGDISGGVSDLRQFLMRPVLSLHPWRTPAPGLYLCSASTPPGGGVHGMCGLHAARLALRKELRD